MTGLSGGLRSYEAQQSLPTTGCSYTPKLMERIDQAVVSAETRLAAAKSLQELLKRNPDFEIFIDLLSQGGF